VYYLASRIQTELLNIAYRLSSCGRIEMSDFLGIGIDSSSESNRIDSNWNALVNNPVTHGPPHQSVLYGISGSANPIIC